MGRKAVIFDVDGTLAHVGHRTHHLRGPEKNWNAFHGAMEDDEPIEAVAMLARVLHAAAARGEGIDAVIIVTARHDRPDYKQTTIDWLEVHGIGYERLYMRRDNDIRPDRVVKAEILEHIVADGYEPILAIDDRPETVKVWRDAGIITLQCSNDEPSPHAGQTLLDMLVGPCGAGKSTYAAKTYKPHEIVSTDQIRMDLYGNLGHSPEALARVWKLAHGLIRARLDAGVFTVLDATNLDADDRLRVLALLPNGVFARYVVIDRDIDEKVDQRGWRDKDMVIKQHRMFRAEERNILAGDDHPWVKIQDRRRR